MFVFFNFSCYFTSSCLWDPHAKSQIHQLEMVQLRAARYTYNIYTTIPFQVKWSVPFQYEYKDYYIIVAHHV